MKLKRLASAARLPILVIGVGILALLAWFGEINEEVVRVMALAGPVIAGSPILGSLLFVALAALSAMLVFFSGVLLVPVGIAAWGPLACFLLLWAGWFLGGVITYSIGRRWGRPAVLRLVSEEKLSRYENRIPHSSSFVTALLAQLVLPSDVSGYFFGLLGYPARVYFGSLALAELPYALGTVYLGNAFLDGQYVLLAAAAAALLVVLALSWRHHR